MLYFLFRRRPKVNPPVTVASAALQIIDGNSMVFLKISGGFIPQPVHTARFTLK